MKIISLKTNNVMRLSAVEITPEGHMVTVGGRNAQGKTSVLRSIEMALGGVSTFPEKPLRDGAPSGSIVVDLGDIVVKRTFKDDGATTLSVTGKDGGKKTSPQTLLDGLTGRLSFDPLAFSRQDHKKQLETLKALVGLDFTALDEQRLKLFDERTTVGRDGQALKARREAMPFHPDVPAEEIAAADLMVEIDRRRKHAVERTNAELRLNDADRRARESAAAEKDMAEGRTTSPEIANAGLAYKTNMDNLERSRLLILDLSQRLAAARDAHNAMEAKSEPLREALTAARAAATASASMAADLAEKERARQAEAFAAMPEAEPVDPLLEQVRNIDVTNRKVRDNRSAHEAVAQIEKARARWDELTAAIAVIDGEKQVAMGKAKFPVPGLSFDSTGVLFSGQPFSQASGAEQLKVSVAMGLALNPKLKVVLIRDASLLDKDSLAIIADLATKADAQVWLEKVSDDGVGCSVVIEDGMVRHD